jgi:hypothetical protein
LPPPSPLLPKGTGKKNELDSYKNFDTINHSLSKKMRKSIKVGKTDSKTSKKQDMIQIPKQSETP